MSSEFQGRPIFVAGGGSGIGSSVSKYFATLGASVGVIDKNKTDVDRTVEAVVQDGGSCIGHSADTTDELQVIQSIKALVGSLGAPFLLVNCPNFVRLSHFTEISTEDWDSVISNNLRVTFLVTKSVLPHMLGTGGSIVNITGAPGITGVAYSAAFAAASAGVIQLTKSLAVELQDRGVRINAVALSGADEDMLAHLGFPAGAATRHLEKIVSPLGVPSPEEVASLCAYLGGIKARCITGTVIALDGGLSA